MPLHDPLLKRLKGNKTGLATRLREKWPHLVTNHCLAHRLELAFKDSLKSTFKALYEKLMTLLLGLYYLYRKSPKQKKALKRSFKVLNINEILPSRVGGTRWLPHVARAINGFIKGYRAIRLQLESASHNNPKAEGLAKLARDGSIISYMLILKDVVAQLVKFSLFLQKNGLTLGAAYMRVTATKAMFSQLIQKETDDIVKDVQVVMDTQLYQGEEVKFKGQKFNPNELRKKFLTCVLKEMDVRFPIENPNTSIIKASLITCFSHWPIRGSDNISGIVLDLRIKKDVITDNSPVLTELCIILEDIFTRGCRDTSWFNKTNYRYWTWIEKISQSGRYQPAFHMVIDTVKDCKKTCTDSGRGRLFIRSALSKKVLAVPVQQIVKDQQLLQEFYYSYNTVIGDEILSEILISLLLELSGVTFHLKIHNSSFLDKTWELPIYKNFEFVPCGDLGLNVQQVQEYFIVKSIKPGSVAEEDGKIGPGDVIDELYSFALTPLSLPNVHKLMAKHKGLPVYVGVIKLYDRAGKCFPPIVRLLEEININPRTLQKEIVPDDKDNNNSDRKPGHAILPEEEDAERPVHAPDGSALYKATYLGNVDLGPDGRVNRIEDGVDLVLRNHKQEIEVLIDLREKDVIVSDATNNNKVILRQTYTEISACGRRTDLMKYFGYIAGETTCSLARNFLCHVFEARTEDQAKLILCTLAQGFERTHLLL